VSFHYATYTCHLVLQGVPGVLRCFRALEAYQEGQGHFQWDEHWLWWWESCGLAWAAPASWNLDLVSGLWREI
jgi:hypothetical protein